MRRLRVSILGMIAIIVTLGMAFAALRSASNLWFNALYTFTTVVLLVAVIAARFGHRGTRAFWFGFAVFGWGFFFLEMNPWRSPFVAHGFGGGADEGELGGLNGHLLSSNLVYFLVPHLRKGTDDLEAIDKITANTIGIAHLLSTLTLALVGGLVGAVIRRRRRQAQVQPDQDRSSKVVASVVILSGLALGVAASSDKFARPSVPFFPPEVRGEEKGISPGEVEWYSKHLAAMGEPALWLWRDRDMTAYRLLWLPSFDHPVCVRIDRTGDGARLQARVLDGKGGYEPGQVAVEKRLALDSAQWSNLVRHLEAASFWDIPTKLKGDGGCDGDQLIIEGIKGGKYHVVDRWEPDPAYAALCRTMLDLSGLKVQKSWEGYHSASAGHVLRGRLSWLAGNLPRGAESEPVWPRVRLGLGAAERLHTPGAHPWISPGCRN
jgi:hypothetical protein